MATKAKFICFFRFVKNMRVRQNRIFFVSCATYAPFQRIRFYLSSVSIAVNSHTFRFSPSICGRTKSASVNSANNTRAQTAKKGGNASQCGAKPRESNEPAGQRQRCLTPATGARASSAEPQGRRAIRSSHAAHRAGSLSPLFTASLNYQTNFKKAPRMATGGGCGGPFSVLPAHTQLLQEALRQAALADSSLQTRARLGGWGYAELCLRSPALTLTATGLIAVCILLVVLPPFVLLFEYDSNKPWRASSRVMWFSVAISVLLTLIVAVGLPVMFGATF